MKPALPAGAPRGGSRVREGVLVLLLVAAAVLSALLFDAAVHPERLHDPRHHARFHKDCEALPALGATRVRWTSGGPQAIYRLGAFGEATGLTPEVLGLFRSARYLRASPEEVADAVALLKRDEAPTPPPLPDLSLYYRDARGPYLCDLVLRPGASPASLKEKFPGMDLSGEPVAREAEDREAAAIARALLLGLFVIGGWTAWRRGLREAELRLLAAFGVLVVGGLLGSGVDRWSVAALLLVAGAPSGAPLLVAAPCMLFGSLALQRMGLVLCLGGALRLLLRRPVLPRLPVRRAMVRPALLAIAIGAAGYLALARVPLDASPSPEVAAEPGALLVARGDLAKAAARLRSEGFTVTGDEPLLPPPPEPKKRRDLWRIFTRARMLANRSEGEARARFEDVSDAASQMSLTTLPRDLRARLLTRDGRAALWAPADADRDDLTSARLYRVRGELDLRKSARLAGVLVTVLGAVALAILGGGTRRVLLRFAGAAAGTALLLLADPAGADSFIPLVALAAAAPAVGPALALLAASAVYPGLLWPAAGLLAAAGLGYASSYQHTLPR